jgi:hypothetical protein
VLHQKQLIVIIIICAQELKDDLTSELSGDLENICEMLVLDHGELDAYLIHKAVTGLGTDEKALIEIIMSRTNARLADLNKAYKTSEN